MGVVYRAKDPSIGRIVAVKTIRLSEEGTGMSHADLVQRFQTEARAAGLLTHPNIVVIYDVGESDGIYYITMELVNGKSLQALLDSGEKFPLRRLLRIMEQVCSALQYAHDHRVVHRDIKPANIMLTGEDFVKVTDFGTAQIMQYGAAQQTSAIGTPGYMSPEQIKSKPVDGRTDIFSLGVMLYELTTRQKPFRGQDIATILYQILNEEPVPPQQLNPDIPLGVSSAILKAMSKSPYQRYENCQELLEDLKNYRPGEKLPSTDAASSIRTPASRPATRQAADKNYHPEMPRIPGVEARPASPTHLVSRPAASSRDTPGTNVTAPTARQDERIYAGPMAKPDSIAAFTRVAKIGAYVLLAALFGSFAIRMIGRMQPSDSNALPPSANTVPSTPPQDTETGSVQRSLYVSQANPLVATINELAQPWSSKKFLFRSLSQSKYVPALIIRLPGPASASDSYWAFSLDAPFSHCQFAYIDRVANLSSDYGFKAEHPMVVNPCSRAIHDPLQHTEITANILVRGAVVQGTDLRPPYSIELQVRGNQIRAVSME